MRPVQGVSGDEEPGLYLFDIGSTHGTFLNKQRVEANCYNRVKVGHVIKFGSSTRLFIVHGPEGDAPAASPYTITEIKERNAEIRRKQQEMIEERKRQLEEKKKKEAESGVNWGFTEDAEQESDEDDENGPKSVNPFSMPEELNLEDPKKTLKGCFEREGFELEYICEEEGFGTHICKIELPMVDSEDGKPVFAEVANKGKKRDVQVQCALEACRILDAHGILRASSHERHEVKKRNWAENDYYDSDDDTYLDRTGSVEAKRKKRMERLGAEEDNETEGRNKVHTYESLSADLVSAQEELSKLEQRIRSSKSHVDKMTSLDSLDQYMQGMKSGQEIDATTRRKMKMRTIELKKEIAKIEKMKEAAKPAEIKLKDPSKDSNGLTKSKSLFSGATSRFGFSIGASKLKQDVAKVSVNGNDGDNPATINEVNPLIAGAGGNSFKNADSEFVVKESEDGTEYEDTNSDIDNKTDKAEQSSVDGIGANDHNSQEAHKGTQQPSSFTNSLTSALETAKKLSHDNAHVLENICRTEKPNAKSSSSSSRLSSDSPLKSRSAQESATVTANCFNPTTHDKTRDSDQISSNDDEAKEEEDLTEGDSFSGWVPPSDQQGDGKTALNSLLGY
ncbi:kanadaptin-like isoform X2 [Convolutriloba macropyga]